ncbi:AAA family ATPase [Nakamurella lactea]|uniref:AAA family ATPase n=1 Tax=Nakamurella lactea TaxID=459515 RepID=UPI00041F1C14|nr:AAA family ATPase [Nakamurella lactea]
MDTSQNGRAASGDAPLLADRGVGARWWSLDIHAHSPTSFDYGGLDGTQNNDPKPTHKEWIRAYIDSGVDGIVIADHNTYEGIEPARAALAQLREEDPSLPMLVIFPGVELTVTGGIHVLAIFDPQCSAEVVQETLTLCEFRGARGRSDETANVTVSTAAKIVAERGGLFVPAHADQRAGVFSIGQRELQALRDHEHIHAVEVIDDSEIKTADRWNWVPLLGSDAHHLTTESHPEPALAKAPGTHLTLVKAETLDLKGLRLALTDPAESIRRCHRGYIDPNEIDHGHINSLMVNHRGAVETYRFGPWMNCLIGGRGVGKSTVIELLRMALGRTDELPAGVAEDLRRFNPTATGEEQWWEADTRIVIKYTKDHRLLRVTWSGSDPERSTIELWDGSQWETQSGRVLDRAPVRVFSQKQIYELASRPQSFLTILDDMPSIRRGEWDEEYEALQLRFKSERNTLRQLRAETEKADRIRGELQDVRGRLQHLEDLRATSEYQEMDALEARLHDSGSAEEQATDIEPGLVRVCPGSG